MASPSQILKLLVQADVDGAVAGLKKVGAAADKDLGKAETKAQETSAKLTKMGAASLAAGAVMATALYSTIGPASDLAEAINVTGLTFGESADEMEKWAEGAAQAFGQSKRQALEGASAIGGLLNNVGFLGDESADLSRKLVVLASDMASAFNTDPAQALEALRSGLAGQSEPLRAYNVFLSDAAIKQRALEEGIWDGVGAMDEHEKALARLSIIMEQTSSIQGDFAATADGAANAQRVMAAQLEDLKAQIGQAVLPIFQQAVGALNALLGAFNGLPGPIKDVVGLLAVLGTGFTLAGGAALTMLGRVKDLNAGLTTMAAKLNMSKGALIAWGAAITAAIALQHEWSSAREQADNADAAFAEGLKRSAAEVDNTVAGLESMVALFDGRLASGFANMQGGIQGVAESLVDGTFDMKEFIGALIDGGVSVEDAAELAADMAAAFANSGDAIQDAASRASDSDGKVAALAGSVDSLYRSAENAAGSVSSFGDNVSIMTEPLRTFEEIADDAADALDRIFETILDGKKIQADFEQALDDATDAVQEHGAEFDLSTEAGRDYLANQEDVVDAMHDTAQAMVDQQRPADEIRRRLQGMVTDYTNTLVAAGLSRAEAELLAEALLEIPEQVETELKNNGYDQMMSELAMIMSYLDQIEGQHNAQVFVTPSYSSPSGGGAGPAEDTSSGGGGGSSTGPGGASFGARSSKRDAPTEITINNRIEVDGREIAKVIERESDQGGGLKVKIRGGQ